MAYEGINQYQQNNMKNNGEKDPQELIREEMINIYNKNQEPNGQNKVLAIAYYNQLVFQNTNSKVMYGAQDIFIAQKNNQNGKNEFAIYQGGQEIAEIDENSIIKFSPEYLNRMKEVSPQIYSLLKEIDGQKFALPNIQEKDEKLPKINENNVKNFALNGQELAEEQEKMKLQKNIENGGKQSDEDLESKQEEQEKEQDEMENIAKQTGLTKEDIKSCSTINPHERVTTTQSFEDIANITGQYTKIFVVAANSHTNGTSKFAFYGLKEDGQVEQIKSLQERNGVNTGKSVYTINRDGSAVKEQQTAAMFTLPDKQSGFSVSIGQYGIVETAYIRKDPNENKYIGSNINSSTQKPTTREVQEFMGRTNANGIDRSTKRIEHQLSETGGGDTKDGKTNLSEMDNNPNTSQAIDPDIEITLHDNTVTTLGAEAERLNVSLDEYLKMYEEIQGDCPSDKIFNIRNEEREDDKQHEGEMDRGERLTPEEEALRKLGF